MTGLAGSQSYNYDALYRITNPNYPGQSDAYIYDANGNRTLYNEVQYSYDAADQLTCARFWWEQWCPSGGTAYGYDANGNQTSRGSDTFTYDHENRLTQSVIGGATSSSTYNGDGLRMSHTVSGQATSYTWDVAADLPVVLQDGTNTYVYGLDLISATDGSGAQTSFLYDGLGSTTDLVDSSGTVNATYSYDVFGAIRSQSGTSPNYWLFTGEQRDADSSLYYLRARYYDPAIGRFLAQDPAGAGHPYAYAENNPVNFIDPSGLTRVTADAGGGGMLGPGLNIAVIGGVTYIISVSADGAVEGIEAFGSVTTNAANTVGGVMARGAEEVWGGVTGLFGSGKKPVERDRDWRYPRWPPEANYKLEDELRSDGRGQMPRIPNVRCDKLFPRDRVLQALCWTAYVGTGAETIEKVFGPFFRSAPPLKGEKPPAGSGPILAAIE